MELRLPSHFGGTVADYGFRSTLRILVVDSMEAMGSVDSIESVEVLLILSSANRRLKI